MVPVRRNGSGMSGPLAALGLLTALIPLGCGGDSDSHPPAFADVVVTSFTVTVNGDVVSWAAEIKNEGTADAIDFFVDIYWDRATAPVPNLFGDDFQFVPLVAPGQSRTVPFSTFGVQPGTYNSWVQIDTIKSLTESDTDNNVEGPETYTVAAPAAPDLVITAFTPAVNNLDVDYTITIENQGTGAAGGFFLDIYYDQAQAPGPSAPGDDYVPVFGLTASSSLTFVHTQSGAFPGVHDAWAQIDTIDQVVESDEGNNVIGPVQVTVGAPATPELVISSFTPSVAGQDVTYDLVVENIGSIDAGAFSVDLYYDRATAPGVADLGDTAALVPSLPGGTSTPITLVRVGAPTGGYQSWAQVDTFDAVVETFENNNVAGPASILVGPELRIVYFRVDFNGADADYTLLAENFGSQAPGAFFLDLYYDRAGMGAPLPFDPFYDDFYPIADLPPGILQPVPFTQIAPTSGNESWAQIDSDDSVPEVDETNNTWGPVTFDVTDTVAADVEVTQVTTSVAGRVITYDVVLTNLGATTADDFYVDVYLDRPVAPLPEDFDTTETVLVPTLPPLGTTTVPITVDASKGTYRSWVQADTDKRIAESNEGNNVSFPLPVTVP